MLAKILNVYKVTLRLNGWGLTLPILALPTAEGANNLSLLCTH